MQEGNPNLGALEIDPADIPAEGNIAEPAGREWPTTLQGWREHYRGGGLTYAKAGYLRYSRSPEQGQAARERARALSGQMPKEQYESLFASPQLPADEPELELGPAFQNPNPNPPRSAPLNREPADEPELELEPISKTMAETRPAPLDLGGGPSPLVDWIGAARKTRGRSGVGGTGGIKAPPIASQVPPEIPEALPEPVSSVGVGVGALGGAVAGLEGGVGAGIGTGAVAGLMAGGPWGAAIGAGAGLLGGLVNAAKPPQGSIADYQIGGGSERSHDGSGVHMQGLLSALNKIAGIRSRL